MSDHTQTFLTERFDEALVFARQRHNDQERKGTSIPYVSHLMSTAALVLEAGGDEDQAIAGLLHDALEDEKATYAEVEDRFGSRVAGIVRDCSDAEGTPKPPWRDRKEQYLAALLHHDADSVLVSNADKLHNARSILSDYRRIGEELWERFKAGSDQLWYYRALVDTFTELRSPLAMDLDLVVTDLETEVTQQRT